MVTIIIPTYNRAYVLWRAINSVLMQTYPDFELIVVDDHSSDGTNNYKRIYRDKRIHFIDSEATHSVSGARNTGLKHANGDLIAYLDSDNVAHNDWLETMIYYIDKNPNKNVFFPAQNTKVEEVSSNGDCVQVYKLQSGFKKPLTYKDIWAHTFECDPNGMFHRSIVKTENIKWDQNLKSYEDFDFVLQILSRFGDTVFFVDKVLIDYVRTYGSDSLCGQNSYSLIIEQLEYIQQKYLGNKMWNKYSTIPTKLSTYKRLNDYGYTPLEYIRERFIGKSK